MAPTYSHTKAIALVSEIANQQLSDNPTLQTARVMVESVYLFLWDGSNWLNLLCKCSAVTTCNMSLTYN